MKSAEYTSLDATALADLVQPFERLQDRLVASRIGGHVIVRHVPRRIGERTVHVVVTAGQVAPRDLVYVEGMRLGVDQIDR